MRRRVGQVACGIAALTVVGVAAVFGAKAELDGGYTISKVRELRRERADARLAATLQAIPCPKSAFVIAALGQSNAGNHLGPRVAGDPALPVYAYFRDRCVALQDPVPGATGEDGSLWTELALQLARSRREPIVVIAGAAAGSSVRDWDRDHAGMTSRALRSLAAAARDGLAPRVVVWLQGETDAEAGMSQATYASLLEKLVERISAAIASASSKPTARPAWIITQTSRCWGSETRSEDVRAGQRAVAAKIANGHPGPDTDALDDSYRRDGCHFSERGRQRIVAELVEAIAKVGR